MARHSKINRLLPELKCRIGKLWDIGATLDQVIEVLRRGVAVSRLSLGHLIQQRDKMVEHLRHSHEIANFVGKNLGKTHAVLIETLYSLIRTNRLDVNVRADLKDKTRRKAVTQATHKQGLSTEITATLMAGAFRVRS